MTDTLPRTHEDTGLKRLLRRFTASDRELDAEALQQVSARSGAEKVCDCPRGKFATVTGRLTSVRYTPRTNQPTLEAELFDGSGSMTIIFIGRRRIAGIEPGRSLTVEGRLALRDGRKVIFNPAYTLEPTTP
ncbi:OB-fold nucleic acid binding domain-containing protein [Cryptosporangium phraense]|uniref:DNA-binding protein n=1 Tax=Cryptosporangium phraense TaxID=2593070 RepID=A0A545AIX2_9ACTN|nr:OB-fold nucleic acid binding domain-containing protein [Cryptosporangium phraense]TQS41271.1 DNA-binding protein [Cryptosporangium phraense]